MPGDDPNTRDMRRDIWSITRLNREARALIEAGLPMLWVEGEISNLARPASGHLYFSLKDDNAQVRCAMFKGRNRLLDFRPENGQQVTARVRAGIYEGRGEFQLVVESMEPAGAGALWRAFEQLKQRLEAEGLFAEQNRQALPALARRIGVITSPSGAAVRDIISVLDRRFPAIEVVVYPAPVQGSGAAQKIAAMIALADARAEVDVLVLARGGGSLEDLWAFNEEPVARAIHACSTPLVTGIGHETDFTIADFAADRRAPTPSAAAELLSPDQVEWRSGLLALQARLQAALNGRVNNLGQRLDWLAQRLQHPGRRLLDIGRRADDLSARLMLAWEHRVRALAAGVAQAQARLRGAGPAGRIEMFGSRYADCAHRLQAAARARHRDLQGRLATLARALDTVSPLATLARGYAIVTLQPDGEVLRDVAGVRPGGKIQARLARGSLACTVDRVDEDRS